MIGDNHHYGHDQILRDHSNLKLPWPIPARLQHGWMPGLGMAERLLAEPWPKLVWTRRNLTQCWERGHRDVVPIGAPFVYLPPARTSEIQSRGPRSLLVYPFHGWEKGGVHGDMKAYADALTDLEKEGFGPITVCLYWIEYEDPGLRAIFNERGWRVITNGHRDKNPTFLHRQRASMLEHAYVTSNRVCTAAFYAPMAGRRFFLYGPTMGLSATADPTGVEYDAWQRKQVPELTFEAFGDRLYQDIGRRELGADYKLEPAVMRELFGWHPRGMAKISASRFKRELWKIRPLRPFMSA